MMMISRRVHSSGHAFTRSMSSSSNLSPVAAKAAKLDRMLQNSGVRKAIQAQMSPFGNQ